MIKGIKICGVSNFETLKYIINHPYPPNFIGFITNYKKSKRYIDLEVLKKLTSYKNDKISYVSVLVNPNDEILEKIKDMEFDYYQLYNVTPERTMEIKRKYKKKIISAITVFNKEDVDRYKKYQKISEIILFDGKGYEKSIGFDHKLLKNLPSSLNKMIAGNIKIDDIPNLKNKEYFIDLSGGLENNHGKKDIKKINKLLNSAAKI